MGRVAATADADLDDSHFTADARGMSAFEQHVWMADPNNSRGARAVPLPSRASPPQPYQASARMPAAMPAGEPRPLYSRISSPRSRSKHVRRVRKRNVRKRPPTVQGRLVSDLAGWEPEAHERHSRRARRASHTARASRVPAPHPGQRPGGRNRGPHQRPQRR